MKYIDIHCHLDFPDYEKDREEVLARMDEGQVGAITVGTNLESSKKAVEIANENGNIWASVGIHPETHFLDKGWEELFEELAQNSKVVTIGECGLDYFRIKDESSHSAKATRDKQKELFKKQIEFAIKHEKPLMLHCRDSYDDVLGILKSYKNEAGERLRGNAHFFAGNIEQAKKFLDLGFTMSFTGVITFTSDYDELIKFIPINSIMSETDAPFVAPVPYRGKRNEPAYIMEVVSRLAELKGRSEEEMRKILLENAKKVFSLQT